MGGCQFESNFTMARRRIPYAAGSDVLPKAKGHLKDRLSPSDEKRLTMDMNELYKELLPSPESEQRRTAFVEKIESLLNRIWPGNNIRARAFGSSGNMLCNSDSDGKLNTPARILLIHPIPPTADPPEELDMGSLELESICPLANALAENGMERVSHVMAKVQIVKFWDPELRLSCDMNVNFSGALENTRMIKTYVQIDARVRPLAMIIKHWAKRRELNDAGKSFTPNFPPQSLRRIAIRIGGTLNSYTWMCMIINFLQTRTPPILPVLHKSTNGQGNHSPKSTAPPKAPTPVSVTTAQSTNAARSSFNDDLDSLVGFGKHNKETLGELIFNFFRYYGHELDYENSVISVRRGKLISKEEKGWPFWQAYRLKVEEPFNVERNLGNTADDTSFRGIHVELRRAFTLISENVSLTECCAQYLFPPPEEEREKASLLLNKAPSQILPQPPPPPASQPQTRNSTLPSRSVSQSSRGGSRGNSNSGRGGKHSTGVGVVGGGGGGSSGAGGGGGAGGGSQSQRGSQNRRASSGASYNQASYQPIRSQQNSNSHQEHAYQHQFAQSQLHEHLRLSFQALQTEETLWRYQLHQTQAQQQAQIIAHAQSHTVPTRSSSQGKGQGQDASTLFLNGVPASESYDMAPRTAPIRPSIFWYPLQYGLIPVTAHHGTNTNPSSPLMTPALPELRRSIRRSSVADGSGTGPLRSHSQPAARSMPTPLNLHGLSSSNYGVDGLVGHQQRMSSRRYHHLGGVALNGLGIEPMMETSNGIPISEPLPDDGMPKEYVGYYLDGPLPMNYSYLESTPQPIPSYGDLAQRRRRRAPSDHIPRPTLERLRKPSRSRSPLGRNRSQSNGPVSAPIVPSSMRGCLFDPHETERDEYGQSIYNHGNSILPNGSSIYVENNQRTRQASLSESTSVSDDPNIFTPSTPEAQAQDYIPDVAGGLGGVSVATAEIIDPSTQQRFYAQQLMELHKHAESSRIEPSNPAQLASHPAVVPNPLPYYNTFQTSPPSSGARLTLPNSDDEGMSSPRLSPNLRQRASKRVSLLPLAGVPPLDIGRSNVDSLRDESQGQVQQQQQQLPQHQSQPQPQHQLPPLLSPVLETRTPSPTVNRKFEPPIHSHHQQNQQRSKFNGATNLPPPIPSLKGKEPSLATAKSTTSTASNSSMNQGQKSLNGNITNSGQPKPSSLSSATFPAAGHTRRNQSISVGGSIGAGGASVKNGWQQQTGSKGNKKKQQQKNNPNNKANSENGVTTGAGSGAGLGSGSSTGKTTNPGNGAGSKSGSGTGALPISSGRSQQQQQQQALQQQGTIRPAKESERKGG
ncbi:MAG: hypothetical protein M1829_002057 [Trizodia sp. TS-e1964]|nr:MAG: hypothetical protein M1829_002057 [Trizodia sp. TS-e1964]